MAKYYAITEGEHLDYHIVHITTNKKLAEAYVRLHARKDYDFEYMTIEEYDDLMDQCDIHYTFDKAAALHPYLKIYVKRNGLIHDEDGIKHCLETRTVENTKKIIWKDDNLEEAKIDEYGAFFNFEMWVQIDKYDYNYDKIVKVVMDTRAKMFAEKYGL